MTRKQKLTLCIIAVILGLGIALYPLIYNFYTEKTRMKLAEGERVLHEYDPNEKHIDEY